MKSKLEATQCGIILERDKEKKKGRRQNKKGHPYFFDFAPGLIFSQSLPTQICYESDRLSAMYTYCKPSHPATDTAITVSNP